MTKPEGLSLQILLQPKDWERTSVPFTGIPRLTLQLQLGLTDFIRKTEAVMTFSRCFVFAESLRMPEHFQALLRK